MTRDDIIPAVLAIAGVAVLAASANMHALTTSAPVSFRDPLPPLGPLTEIAPTLPHPYDDLDLLPLTGVETQLEPGPKYDDLALVPYFGTPPGLMTAHQCGSVGTHWTDGAWQGFTGDVAYSGTTTVQSGVLMLADPRASAAIITHTGAGTCIDPSEGCTSTRYFCDCPTVPDRKYVYSCGEAPGAAPTWWCDEDGDLTQAPGETITCTLTQSEAPADSVYSPAGSLEWVSAGLPGVVLVDDTLDLAGADLTVTGTAPPGAVLLQAGTITGSPGTLTAPAGLQIVVDSAAGVIRLEAAP
jgi:hypothetical protein